MFGQALNFFANTKPAKAKILYAVPMAAKTPKFRHRQSRWNPTKSLASLRLYIWSSGVNSCPK